MLALKRAYDEAQPQDGYRLLVDRLWPRGVSKEEAKLDDWSKALAPSDDLRKWFHDHDDDFESFKKKFIEELENSDEAQEAIKNLKQTFKEEDRKKLTLVYASKNEKENNAVVLKTYLEDQGF